MWLLQGTENPKWVKLVWSRTCIPRHYFTMWLFMENRLPVLQRISKLTAIPLTDCPICKQSPETHKHLFFNCPFARDIWNQFSIEWGVLLQLEGKEAFITYLCNMRKPRRMRSPIQVLVSAVIHQIWLARNRKIYKNVVYSTQEVLKEIRRQITHRVNFTRIRKNVELALNFYCKDS